MGRLVLILLMCVIANTAKAACPGDRDDGKRVTVAGTIFHVEQGDGKHYFGLKECGILVEAKHNGKGSCKVGKTLTATGMFIRCDWLIECYKEDGDLDIIQASKVACR